MSKNWRLTSARISDDSLEAENLSSNLDEADVSEEDTSSEEKNAPEFEVEGWIVHEDYNSTSRHNDIALIKLRTEVKFVKTVKPICLPWPQNLDKGNLMYFAAGWSIEHIYILSKSFTKFLFKDGVNES